MGNQRRWVSMLAAGSVLAALSLVHCGGQVRADSTDDAGAAPGTAGDANVDPYPDYDAFIPYPDYDANVFGDDGGGSTTTLYERLGQHEGIAALVKESIQGMNGVLSDPQIASYFAIRTGQAGGAPSASVVEDCFTNFVAKAAGGPEPYPFTSIVGGTNFVCRDMATAHAGLGVTNGAFQKFVSILAAKYSAAGVSQVDLQSLGGALLGTASDIVDRARNAAQLDAGNDAAWAAQNYGAPCSAIVGGSASAPGCATP